MTIQGKNRRRKKEERWEEVGSKEDEEKNCTDEDFIEELMAEVDIIDD